MTKCDKMQVWSKGSVHGYIYDSATGAIVREITKRNTITYAAADIMARLIGDSAIYTPRYMGFVYGPNASPGAALTVPPFSRLQVWDTIGADELSDAGVAGNVLITPLAAGAQYSIDGSAVDYTGNVVTLTANTGARTEYGFPVGSGGFAGDLANGDYIYQAMLITRLVSANGTITYLPFSRVDLSEAGPVYPQKASGYELALFWSISYF